MTRRDLAERTSGNPTYLGEILAGKRGWTPRMVNRVAAALGVKAEVLLGTSGAQGLSIETYRTGGGARWAAVEEASVEYTDVPAQGELAGFRVEGDSMEPIAREGQVILALRNVQPQDGDLAHVELEDGTVAFKRVYLRRERWLLVSVNPAYDPRDVPVSEIRRAMKVWGVKF